MIHAQHRFETRPKRTLTILTVARIVVEDGREGLGRIRNISETGLMLETAMMLHINESVQIELRSQQVLSGRVIWSQDGRFGVQLDQSVDVADAIASLPPPPRSLRRSSQPRSPRVAADCHIEVQAGGQRFQAQLLDISQGGAKIVLGLLLRREERVLLLIPGLPLKLALVRWTAGGETGLRFAEPLPFSALTEWLAVRQEGDFNL